MKNHGIVVLQINYLHCQREPRSFKLKLITIPYKTKNIKYE